MAEPVLAVRNLSRWFGGLSAVSDVSLDLDLGEIHAVIGPNGAGKTTLVNLLSGVLRPHGGSIRLAGGEIAGLPPERISRLGLARSYQRSTLFQAFSAFENCRLAAQSRLKSSMRFFRPAASYGAVTAEARRALDVVGFDRAERSAETLSHGERRQLEIAMTLATRPQVLLLDEPLAGTGAEEAARLVELIAGLGRDHAVLLIEHDMDAVFSIADRLTVMVNGRVLETGTPAQIRASAAVQEAYLGAEALRP